MWLSPSMRLFKNSCAVLSKWCVIIKMANNTKNSFVCGFFILLFVCGFFIWQVINLYQMTPEMWEERITAWYAEHRGRARWDCFIFGLHFFMGLFFGVFLKNYKIRTCLLNKVHSLLKCIKEKRELGEMLVVFSVVCIPFPVLAGTVSTTCQDVQTCIRWYFSFILRILFYRHPIAFASISLLMAFE